MTKLKPIIPEDIDPIELADKIKRVIFKDTLKRLRRLAKFQ